jgi:hypothetical protein
MLSNKVFWLFLMVLAGPWLRAQAPLQHVVWLSECDRCTPNQLARYVDNEFQKAVQLNKTAFVVLVDGQVTLSPLRFTGAGSVKHIQINGTTAKPPIVTIVSETPVFAFESDLDGLLFESARLIFKLNGETKGLFEIRGSGARVAVSDVAVSAEASKGKIALKLLDFSEFNMHHTVIEGMETGVLLHTNLQGKVTIQHSHLRDFTKNGFVITGPSDVVFQQNQIMTRSINADGFTLENIQSARIERNQIAVSGTAMKSKAETTTQSFLVVNNMFSSGNTASVFFDGVNMLEFYHNSCRGVVGLVVESIGECHMINNIFFGTRSFAVRFNQLPFQLQLDYNIYHSQTPLLARMTDHIFHELSNWQQTDTLSNKHSLQGDPFFFSATDLHVMGLLAKNTGYNNLGINIDFDGDPRPIPAGQPVDIGADEFEQPFVDVFLKGVIVDRSQCGDSAIRLRLEVQNLGTAPISNGLGVSVSVLGAAQHFFQFVYSGTLFPGQTDTLLVGYFKFPFAGNFTLNGLLTLAGDQRLFNNQISGQDISILPAFSNVNANPIVCHSDSLVKLVSASTPNTINLWFDQQTDPIPAYVGDTFYFPNTGTNTMRWVAVFDTRKGLVTQWNGIQTSNISRFNLTAKQNLMLRGITLVPGTSGTFPIEVLYRNSVGSNWNIIQLLPQALVTDLPVYLNLSENIFVFAGEQLEIQLRMPPQFAFRVAYQSGIFLENDEVILDSAWLALNGGQASGGVFCGQIHYLSEQCYLSRLPVTVSVQFDSASAQFTYFSYDNGRVEFNAQGSFGHQFFWDFGDGSIGFGMKPVKYYRTEGDYTVKLIVVDTVCNTIDTLVRSVGALLHNNDLQRPQVKLYPNPVMDVLKIEFGTQSKSGEVRLLDPLGQLVIQQGFNHQPELSIDLSHLAAGTYLLEVIYEDGLPTIYKILRAHSLR